MNRLIIMAVISIFLLSCNRQLYKAHPNCTEYFDYTKGHWEKKGNGWYTIKVDKVDSTAAWIIKHIDDPPVFIKQWKDNKKHCLCTLNKKEVGMLFGKPTKVKKTFNVIEKAQIETFMYMISDGECDESAKSSSDPNPCGGIRFSFIGDNQYRGCSSGLTLWDWSLP